MGKYVKLFEEFFEDDDFFKQEPKSEPTIEEIEANGIFFDDYTVDEYDEIEEAGYIEMYDYNGVRYFIATWKPESERGHIGKEITKKEIL